MTEKQAETSGQNGRGYPSKRILKWVLYGLAAGLLAVKFDAFLLGFCGWAKLSLAWMLPLAVVGLAAVAYLLVMLVLKLLRRKTIRFWNRVTPAALLVVLYFVPVVSSRESYSWGFRFWCQRNIDIPAVVEWADRFQPPPPGSQPTTIPEDERENFEVPYRQLPPELQRTLPPHIGDQYIPNLQMGPRPYYSRTKKTLSLWYGTQMMGFTGITVGRGCAKQSEPTNSLHIGDDAFVWLSGN